MRSAFRSVFRFLPLLLLVEGGGVRAWAQASRPVGGPLEVAPAQSSKPTADLSQHLAENLLRYFPKTTAALRARQGDISISVVGDGIANNWQPEDEDRYRMETSWHGFFLQRLANTFIYTGGLRFAGPSLTAAKKKRALRKEEDQALGLPGDISLPLVPLSAPTSGPGILVDILARDNASAVQAFQWLTTSAFDAYPTLVILQYGFTDALTGQSLGHFRAQVEAAVRLCKQKQVDVMLAGPPLAVGNPARHKNSLTRPFAKVLEEIALQEKVFYVDFGAAQADFVYDSELPLSSVEDSFREHLNSQYPREAQSSDTGPNVLGHRIYSEAVWLALAEAPVVHPLPKFTAKLQPPPQGSNTWKLNLSLSEVKKGKLEYIMLGADRCWRPLEAPPADSFAPPTGEVDLKLIKALQFAYEAPAGSAKVDTRRDLPFGEGGPLQTSLFALYNDRIHLVDVPTVPVPLAVAVAVSRSEGLTDLINLTATISPTPGVSGPATLRLHWMDQVQEMPVTLTDSAVAVGLRLPLPMAGEPRLHFKKELLLELVTPQGTATTTKELECTRHLGLEKKLILTQLSHSTSRPESWSNKVDPLDPGLTVLADASGLYFVLDLPPNEGSRGNSGPSAKVSFTVDARGPKERGLMGFVDPVELDVPWEDGRFEVDKPRNAVFGSGYDRELEKKWFLASVTTLSTGRRQVRLSIPRNYFYLHQWSLGKTGQNSLGVNVTVALAEVDAITTKTSFPPSRVYALVSPGLARHDALGLAVLELDSANPVRWSAVTY